MRKFFGGCIGVLFLISASQVVAEGAVEDGEQLVRLIESEAAISNNEEDVKIALLCFLTGEQISGLNKICFYDCAGSGAAITISSTSLCPLSINR